MRLTHSDPNFDWKHKTELFKAEINFLFDQAQLQGSISIYLTEDVHHKHFPDLLLEVLQRNAEYKTHFQISSNSGVITLYHQKGESSQKNAHPKLDALLNPLLPTTNESSRSHSNDQQPDLP